MRIALTGSSGRVGRAIFSALAGKHQVIGIDRAPFSTTHIVGDFAFERALRVALAGADAVIHAAALRAPHVGFVPDEEFHRINVEGTRLIAKLAAAEGVKRLVFTSTSALYGHAVAAGSCTWINEGTQAQPKSIYHRTKLEAEGLLEEVASSELRVRVLRMSRSFPEPACAMAAYRLHRGIDVRDVSDAHSLALTNEGMCFERYIISAATPFDMRDCEHLAADAASVINLKATKLAAEFVQRGWTLPSSIDRVYDSALAEAKLGWRSRFGFEEVLAQVDRRSLEVLPAGSAINMQSE